MTGPQTYALIFVVGTCIVLVGAMTMTNARGAEAHAIVRPDRGDLAQSSPPRDHLNAAH